MTESEKRAMRRASCRRCGAAPPCHVHRIIPGSRGGIYVQGNVEPRCPSCHDLEHGGNGTAPFIGAAREAGKVGGRNGSTAEKVQRLTEANARLSPERRSEIGIAGARARQQQHPGLSQQIGLKSWPTLVAARAKLSPEWRNAVARKGALALNQRLTPEQRSERARKAGRIGGRTGPHDHKSRHAKTLNHTRWHAARGIVNPACVMCCPGNEARL